MQTINDSEQLSVRLVPVLTAPSLLNRSNALTNASCKLNIKLQYNSNAVGYLYNTSSRYLLRRPLRWPVSGCTTFLSQVPLCIIFRAALEDQKQNSELNF